MTRPLSGSTLLCIGFSPGRRRMATLSKALGRAMFSALKPGTALVDLSRGGIIGHGQMIAALDGRFKGAALDAFPAEPLSQDNLLWRRDDVRILPHCSRVYEGGRRRVQSRCSSIILSAGFWVSCLRTWLIRLRATDCKGAFQNDILPTQH